jgi:hypothetical protein
MNDLMITAVHPDDRECTNDMRGYQSGNEVICEDKYSEDDPDDA